MEVLGTDGRIAVAPNGDGTFRVELHSGFGGMAACDFTWDGLTALSSLALLQRDAAPRDPRDPDPSREGIFRNHNCAYCDNGKKPCRQGNPNRCDNPHARND